MKRFLSTLVCAVILPLFSNAQDFSSFGIVTPEEIALKECPFDKEAAAVVLLDEAVAQPEGNNNLALYRHVRIKILKESGFSYANIEIPYYRKGNLEFVDHIEAMITNYGEDGRPEITTLDKKSFYKKDDNELWGNMVFTFPKVKTGSIIEYKYRKFSDHYGFLDDWKFHDYLPVVKSAFTLFVPPRLEFAYLVQKLQDFPVIIRPNASDGKVYFEMNNLPGLEDEPYMDARKDYIQKAIFQLSGVNSYYSGYRRTNTTWAEVITEFQSSSSFGSQLRKNLAGVGDVMDSVKRIASDEEKMKTLYNFVRYSMSWNGFNSKYAGDGVKDAWNKKSGTNGEINLILINLLKDAGLEVYPLLVSERSHGKVKTDYPIVDQFNTVYAYVLIKDKKYYLDATDKFTPAEMIPKDILNTNALVVNRKNGGLIKVTNEDMGFYEYINTLVDIDKTGKVTGESTIRSEGYARTEKLAAYKRSGEEKFISFFLKNDDLKVTDFKLLNKDNDSLPAEQQFKITGQLIPSGDYLFFTFNNFTGFYKNPFLSQTRFSDINFGYKRKVTINTAVQLPKEYALETLPKTVRMVTPDNDISFARSLEYDRAAHAVNFMFVIDFKKSLYGSEEYPVLQQVYKKMYEFLKEPLVLKKKP